MNDITTGSLLPHMLTLCVYVHTFSWKKGSCLIIEGHSNIQPTICSNTVQQQAKYYSADCAVQYSETGPSNALGNPEHVSQKIHNSDLSFHPFIPATL